MAFGGFRGGWKPPLLTINLMADPLPQPSLSESLQLGAGKAHRQELNGGDENRNFRRDLPTGRKYLVTK